MRILVLFDLPTETDQDRKHYRVFRKYLMQNGFVMLQESVYSRLAINASVAEQYKKGVRKHLPPNGLVQMITLTEKQFQSMETLVGAKQSVYCDSDKRLLFL